MRARCGPDSASAISRSRSGAGCSASRRKPKSMRSSRSRRSPSSAWWRGSGSRSSASDRRGGSAMRSVSRSGCRWIGVPRTSSDCPQGGTTGRSRRVTNGVDQPVRSYSYLRRPIRCRLKPTRVLSRGQAIDPPGREGEARSDGVRTVSLLATSTAVLGLPPGSGIAGVPDGRRYVTLQGAFAPHSSRLKPIANPRLRTQPDCA